VGAGHCRLPRRAARSAHLVGATVDTAILPPDAMARLGLGPGEKRLSRFPLSVRLRRGRFSRKVTRKIPWSFPCPRFSLPTNSRPPPSPSSRSAASISNNSPACPRKELIACIGEYDGWPSARHKVDEGCAGRPTKLKVVGRAGIGVDNVDISAATAAGVIV